MIIVKPPYTKGNEISTQLQKRTGKSYNSQDWECWHDGQKVAFGTLGSDGIETLRHKGTGEFAKIYPKA
jgi:hypothetical protein